MGRNVSNFMIGLFVTVGILVGVGVIVWVGASQYFEKGGMYVTYFDESVQGLQRDSSVKYRGVDVGRIVKLGVAPDNRLIEVVMKIDLKNDLEKKTVAQLKAAGITGIVFVELDILDSSTPDLSPRLDFAAQYPVIQSRPSEVRQILSRIDEVVDNLNKIDVKGMSDQFKSAARSAENFLSGSRTTRVMSNLESATKALDKSMTRLEKIISEGNLEKILTEARQTVTETRALISGVKNEVKAMKLTDTADKANQVAETLDRSIRASAVDIQTSTENLRRASESLDRLLERLEDNPSDLIFSKQPEPRR